jgi:hypothetical protein
MNQPEGFMAVTIVVAGKQLSQSGLDAVFGVTSTSTWKAKPEVVAQAPELDKEEWRFELPARSCFSFSDAIDPLIDRFRSQMNEIVAYCTEHRLKISSHIHLDGMDRNFILGFDRPATLIDLAKLGSELYIHTEQLQCLQAYSSEP